MEICNREFSIDARKANNETRTAPVVLSTEFPYDNGYFVEVLDHSPGSVDFRQSPLPVLESHDGNKLNIGIVEDLKVTDRKTRGTLRLGQSDRAKEVWNDILDGIIQSVSIGYVVHESHEEENNVVRVTKFTIHELSLVAVPADPQAGLYRNYGDSKMSDKENESRSQQRSNSRAAENERERVSEIYGVLNKYASSNPEAKRIAERCVANGSDSTELRNFVLDSFGGQRAIDAEASDIGMTARDVTKFSFVRAINAMINKDWSQAGFERECSEAVALKMKRSPEGIFIPNEVLKRDLNVGTATAGGNLVSTDLMSGSFIDVLRNKTMAILMGATELTGLVGNVAIPRKTSTSNAYWVAEGVAPTESEPAFDQVTMSPNTLGAFTDFTRKTLLQGTPDIEMLVQNDLASVLAVELDRVIIEGSGTGDEPTGILNTAGIGVVPIGTNGGALTWDHIVDLEGDVAVANADIGNLGYLTNASVRKALKKLTKVSGDAGAGFIWEAGNNSDFGSLNSYRAGVSNNVPSDLTKGTGTNLSGLIFGNFSDLLIGSWSGLDITVDPYTFSSTGTVRVVVMQDTDIAVRHPESFSTIVDATT